MLQVVFAPEAQKQLLQLYRYIAVASSVETASRYVGKVVDHCGGLGIFPERGIRHNDLRPGLRITHYRSRTSIAFSIHDKRIEILGVFHGGRDYTRFLKQDK